MHYIHHKDIQIALYFGRMFDVKMLRLCRSVHILDVDVST